jgi:hypothetical protein
MPRIAGYFCICDHLTKAPIFSAAYELSEKPQLACEIALSHAFCMKTKISVFYNSLFLNSFMRLKKLAQRSQYLW